MYRISIFNYFRPGIFSMILALLMAGFSNSAIASYDEGKQLFQVCAACHTVGKGKLVGPDLKGVTEKHEKEWLYSFIKNSTAMVTSGDEKAVAIFEEYNKIPMPPNDLTNEQIDAILDYVDNYEAAQAETAVVEAAPQSTDAHGKKETPFMAETKDRSRNFRATFFITLALLLISIFDLAVTKIVKARFVHWIVIIISGAIITEITVVEAQNLGRQMGYEPDQPILFSHKVHAGQNKIDCKYCHTTVEESKHAGIPSVQVCMNCHNVVRKGTHTGETEIAKIYKAMEENKAIEWVRVHNLPDHAYFNHAQHVNVGKQDCANCHGDVASMDRIKQVHDLSMGWCIDCHRKTEVQFTENGFYRKYKILNEEFDAGLRTGVVVEKTGGSECSKCHY